jgi:S1-C subfamily serine protease
VQKKIPVVMFHTGLHDDYHRPSDDPEKVDVDGIQQTGRFLFRFLDFAADAPQIGSFRNQSRLETPSTAKFLSRPLPAVPGRLGMVWDPKEAGGGKIVATKVTANSAAAKAGILPKDRILEFAGYPAMSTAEFQGLVLAATSPAQILIERPGVAEPLKLSVELRGTPVRLGVTWRFDAAEPGTLIVNRVIPGSAGDRAGIRVNDRIYRLNDLETLDSDSFQRVVSQAESPIELVVESSGKPRPITIMLPKAR